MEIFRRSSGDNEKGCCRRKTGLLGFGCGRRRGVLRRFREDLSGNPSNCHSLASQADPPTEEAGCGAPFGFSRRVEMKDGFDAFSTSKHCFLNFHLCFSVKYTVTDVLQ
ncbi:unnamed protein product [Gongylonema pulchrum]|uniref:Uncharacterized protein n=1 Tax=Gongylonema pulchrum TaxID=637853 RepID=A0A183ELR4_9BILA|nr:unnamed protein product [Gongylonema pulchrum]